MIKALVKLENGWLYLFGLTEANLNRLEFNREPIFFDFGYADRPDLFGLILYFPELNRPKDVDVGRVKLSCLSFLDNRRGVTPETLRIFALSKSIMEKFRSTPFWYFDTNVEIANPNDKQIFFAGPDEQAIEEYFIKEGLISSQTKRTWKGFGKNR